MLGGVGSSQRRPDMSQYKYLIIGAGMTADAAVQGIRELDAEGSIALIGDDRDPPR